MNCTSYADGFRKKPAEQYRSTFQIIRLDATYTSIYRSDSPREFDMYSIAEGGYQQEENVKKVTDHLNKILMDNKCPYCEGDCDGERK